MDLFCEIILKFCMPDYSPTYPSISVDLMMWNPLKGVLKDSASTVTFIHRFLRWAKIQVQVFFLRSSQQVHRIPGTEYAQHNAVQSSDQDEHSFKARMEKLQDGHSTNLYVEGWVIISSSRSNYSSYYRLPLSIDEEVV